MDKKHWKFKISTRNIIVIIFSITVNMLGRYFTSEVDTPFWLDSVGTIFAAAALGPLAGAIVGGFSNCVFVFFDFVNLFYLIINVLIGITVGYLYPKDRRDVYQIVYTATIVSAITIVGSTLINIFVYNGYTGNVWGDALYARLSHDNINRFLCAILSEAFVDFPDKLLSMAIVGFFIYICNRVPFFKEQIN